MNVKILMCPNNVNMLAHTRFITKILIIVIETKYQNVITRNNSNNKLCNYPSTFK